MGVGHTNEVEVPEAVGWFNGSTTEKSIKRFELGQGMACAVSAADSLYCWGDNSDFILDSQTVPFDPDDPFATLPALNPAITTPMPIAAYDGSTAAKTVKEFHIGQNITCILSMSHEFKCFGRVRDDDQNGNNFHVTFVPVTAPFLAHGLDGTTKIASKVVLGESHACAQLSNPNRDIYCWGYNRDFQVGDVMRMEDRSVPTPTNVINLPTGEDFTMNILGSSSCVVGDTTGGVYCWGNVRNAGLLENPDSISRANLISF